MSVISPDHLLEQADRLIAPPAGGAPRQADLRRAISSAYYALFHAIATRVADDLIGQGQRQNPRYALAYRSVAHSSLRRLCEEVAKPKPRAKYSAFVPGASFGNDLLAVAVALIELQENRHRADYDPLFRVNMSDAVSAVATARAALGRLDKANRAKRKAFVSLVVFSPR